MATTVAGDEPDTAANRAQATTAPRPMPPCQWPTMLVAKLIMRRATPPWVRKLPARMKNGIAMISNFSIPVNSFRPTVWIGTSVRVNSTVSTVSPSAIEIGMPVSISAISSAKIIIARRLSGSTSTPALAARQISTSSTGARIRPNPRPFVFCLTAIGGALGRTGASSAPATTPASTSGSTPATWEWS